MMNKRSAPIKINPADRPAELDELNFNDDTPTSGSNDFLQPKDNGLMTDDIGLTEASHPEQEPTDDDLAPETLISEDGARSSRELDSGNASSADKSLTIVDGSEIGAGGGLDEAEVDPVGAKKTPYKK